MWDFIQVPKGDILVFTGDLTFTDVGSDYYLASFNKFLGKQKSFKEKYVIFGNHDMSIRALGKTEIQKRLSNATYLDHDLVRSLDGFSIYGCSWSPCG